MKIHRLFFILLLLTAGVLANHKASAQTNVVPDNIEFSALKAVYDSLGGATWTTKTNWPAPGAWPASATSAQMATWYGVTVSNGDVTSVSYTGNNVVGKIPAAIGNLSALKTLFFNGNNLTGKIPPAIGQLTNLTYLFIGSQPNLGGPIPDLSTLTKLTTFSLRNNPSLTPGPIPAWILNLTTLTNLDLNGTKRNGAIPSSIGNLVNLTSLDLTVNQLTSPIPISVGALIKLTSLNLSSNQLNGTIPSEIGNLINLTTLNLSSNQLTGAIPVAINQLNKLLYLYLNSNQLGGSIPASLGNITTLIQLNLGTNQLSGAIPDQFGNLSNLTALYLFTNSLTGSIPSSLGSLTKLQYLFLYQNQLVGAIPSSLGNLINLLGLQLHSNQLSGSIPSELGNLTKLTGLYLNTNKLSGPLPSSIGNLVNLTQLYVYTNLLSGELPSTLNNLIKLQYFYAYANQFSGQLPPLNNWTQIYQVYIHTNRFSGQIPDNYFATWTKLGTLSLGTNEFNGPFPSSISACPLLGYLEGTTTRFSSLPSSLLTLPITTTINFSNSEVVSIPNFASQVNKINLSLGLNGNRLDFSQLEPLVGAGIKTLTYAPQKTINDTPTQPLTIGSDFILTARPKGALTSNLKWEKLQPNGVTWLDISPSNADALTGNTYRIVNATTAAEGKYRWSCTSTKATGMTLLSDPIDTKTPERFTVDNWGFQYKYDARKRMIAKKVPGAEWVFMVYDNRDRLVLTQDGEQRKVNKWAFTKYDELNRPIMTGIKDTSLYLTQALMQSAVNAHFAKASAKWGEVYVGNVAGNVHGYSNKSYPVRTGTTATEVDANKYLTITYYDNYNFRTLWAGTYAYLNENLSATSNSITYTQQVTEFTRVTGQVTGTKIRILENGIISGYAWLRLANYYDEKYRIIQSISDTYKGIDRTSNLYDFIGKIIKTQTTHSTEDVRSSGGEASDFIEHSTSSSVTIAASNQSGQTYAEVTRVISTGTPGVRVGPDIYVAPGANYSFAVKGYAVASVGIKLMITDDKSADIGAPYLFIPLGLSNENWTTVNFTIPTSVNKIKLFVIWNTAGGVGDKVFINEARLKKLGEVTKTTTRTFTYDHTGRLLNTSHSINGATPVLLAQNEYNELGQLVDKKLHSADNGTTFKQSVDYRYNIRGWLTSMNNAQLANDANVTNDDTNDLFGMDLGYNNSLTGLGNTAMYNGNISALKWSVNQGLGTPVFGTPTERAYNFVYDPLNRLQSASHLNNIGAWAANTSFNEDNLSYDYNGNIKTLSRKGQGGSIMDVLSYDYGTGNSVSNQLLKVNDTGDKTKGFVDGVNLDNDYLYDVNGNMTVDRNKGITAITYNHLNLPDKVTKSTGDYVKYIYDATGRKLSQQVYNSLNSMIKKTDYAGEYIYENDVLQFVNHEEGRITKGSAGKQIVPSPQLVPNGDATSTAGFGPNASVTITNETQGAETYLKVVSNQATANPGLVSSYITVKPGKNYQYKFKGYRTTSAAYLYVVGEVVGNLVWASKVIPSGAGNEAWVTADFTVPANVTQIKVGALWSPVTIGDIIYANKIELYEVDPVNGTNIEVDVASALPTEYQYHLKDHLGNVRLTFTTKDDIQANTATLETANAPTEQSQFLNTAKARKINSRLFDHTYNGTTPPLEGSFATRLSGSANEKIGLAKSLSVMPGDKIDIEVFAKYIDTNVTNDAALITMLAAIASGGSVPAGTVIDGAGYATAGNATYPFAGYLNYNDVSTAPKAYLNYLIFDRDFVYKTGGFKRITTTARETGDLTNNTGLAFEGSAHERLAFDGVDQILIREPGYVYIWLSNENDTPVEVYFDDFKVTHTKSPVIQQQDYYPFGLTFNSYQKESSSPNQYLYNGKELQDELSLNWLDYGARMYDASIARWMVVDPMAEKKHWQTSYHYCSNDPIRRFDPDGKDDYTVDKKGNIALQKKTDDKQDRLIALGKSGKLAYDQKGNLKNSAHSLEKGVLNQKNHQESSSDPDNPSAPKVSRDHYEIKGQSESKATGLFKFLAKNTSVEWSLSSGTDKGGKAFAVLVTSHEESRVGGGSGLLNWYFSKGYTPKNDYHNHPNGNSIPSGANGDRGYADDQKERFSGMNFFIYTAQDDKLTKY